MGGDNFIHSIIQDSSCREVQLQPAEPKNLWQVLWQQHE